MHIVIIADPVENQKAGVHFYTKNLIRHLLKNDKKNHYTFIHSEKNSFFDNTNNFIIPQKNRLLHDSYRKFYLIPKLIKNLKPDIVLETAHMGPFFIPKTIKRAVIIYDITPILFPKFHRRRSARNHKLLLGTIIKNADLILTISKNTKNDILNHYKTNAQIEVIYCAPNQKKTNSKTQSPHPPQPPYLLYLGTVEPRKNLTTLIKAFKELKNELGTNFIHKLILAGGIGWKSKSTQKEAQHEDIFLTGYVSEKTKRSLYENADMFIYPSIYEGFGMPPLEAMRYKTPVICSSGGSLKELYKNSTLMFDPNDKETLKEHIKTLLINQKIRNTLIKRGCKLCKKFTWDKVAQKTIKAFEFFESK